MADDLRLQINRIMDRVKHRYEDYEIEAETGYFAGQMYPATRGQKSLPLAQIAAQNNSGFYNHKFKTWIPARPFFTDAARDFMQSSRTYGFVPTNSTSYKESFMGLVAEFPLLIEYYIDKNQYEPNAPLTIAIKGSDHPLIDQGILRSSVKVRQVS